ITAPIASRLIVNIRVLKTFSVLGVAHFHRCDRRSALHERSTPGLRAGGLEAFGNPNQTAFGNRLHASRSVASVAVVCAVGDPILEHLSRHIDHLAGRAYGAGDHWRDRGRGRRHGGDYFNSQWSRTFSV